MAYDDVLARTCAYVNENTLRLDLSPKNMEALYRNTDGFPTETREIVRASIETVTYALKGAPTRSGMKLATFLLRRGY